MKPQKTFSIKERLVSFKYAFSGLKLFFKAEHNAWIHLFASVVVIAMGFVYKVSVTEWCFLCFSIAFVIVSEMFNTAIELLCDRVTKEKEHIIKLIKDVSAAATLIAAAAAVVVGLFVFVPKVF